MPTTTPNFGWSVPVSTDLVKDGATAIELLGDSIDASLVDLKGGTTGQVLAKASGTDMDFSWVAQDDSNAIQNAIVDAKGDLIGATAADTPARLAVGTNGQVLTADSTAATGLAWTTPAGGGGKVLQVIQATTTTSTTVASTTYADTTLTATITPTASTSKILVLFAQNSYASRSNNAVGLGVRLLRGSTSIYDVGAPQPISFAAVGTTAVDFGQIVSGSYLDSPATTSAVTYKTQGKVANATNSGESVFQQSGGISTITLLEIGA
jgi:hypothetical protein